MLFGFWIEFRGATKLWIASIAFALIGANILFVLPAHIPALMADPIGGLAIRALGWIFLCLGLLVLLPMLASLVVAAKQPGREAAWHAWVNTIGGIAGALVFAIPSALMLPIFFVAWLRRPNLLFPTDDVVATNLWISALFSVLGIITLAALVFLVRGELMRKSKKRE